MEFFKNPEYCRIMHVNDQCCFCVWKLAFDKTYLYHAHVETSFLSELFPNVSRRFRGCRERGFQGFQLLRFDGRSRTSSFLAPATVVGSVGLTRVGTAAAGVGSFQTRQLCHLHVLTTGGGKLGELRLRTLGAEGQEIPFDGVFTRFPLQKELRLAVLRFVQFEGVVSGRRRHHCKETETREEKNHLHRVERGYEYHLTQRCSREIQS